jgi:hypothetical protein
MDPDKGTGYLTVYEPEASVVRELFARADAGENRYALEAWMNLERLDLRPRGWWVKSISDILTNPVYVGDVVWNKERHSKIDGRYKKGAAQRIRVPGVHEPVVDRDLFNRVQARFEGPPPKSRGQGKTKANFYSRGWCGVENVAGLCMGNGATSTG